MAVALKCPYLAVASSSMQYSQVCHIAPASEPQKVKSALYLKFNIKQNLDNYCIVGSSLLSIFGLRKSRDIDIVSKNIIDNNKIDNHNSHYKKYLNLEADEIIFNPNNHMHFLILNLLFLNYYINLKNLDLMK